MKQRESEEGCDRLGRVQLQSDRLCQETRRELAMKGLTKEPQPSLRPVLKHWVALSHSELVMIVNFLACRPGDTIVVSPGVRHVSAQVAVSWPLKIIGAGSTPEETHFIGAAFDLAAVAFR